MVEVNRAARSLANTVTKAAGDGLTADKKADIALACQQNALQLWSMTRHFAPPMMAGGDPAGDAPKAEHVPAGGVKIAEIDEVA